MNLFEKIVKNFNIFRTIREFDEEQLRRNKHLTPRFILDEKIKRMPGWWQIQYQSMKRNKHIDNLLRYSFQCADFGKEFNVGKTPYVFYVFLLTPFYLFFFTWLFFAFSDTLVIYLTTTMSFKVFKFFFNNFINLTYLNDIFPLDLIPAKDLDKIYNFYYINHIF